MRTTRQVRRRKHFVTQYKSEVLQRPDFFLSSNAFIHQSIFNLGKK